jgi:hypothetical protein
MADTNPNARNGAGRVCVHAMFATEGIVSAQHQAPTASTLGHFRHRIADAASAEHTLKASKMTLGERIALWLREVRGAYCDACIVKEFKLPRRRQINRITNALSATSNFYREKGTCRLCGADRKVIAAV